MIINAIHLYSNDVKYTEFSLDHADQTQSYIIESATGLDVEDITPQFYALGTTSDREKYFDMNLGPREISMLIKLNPQYGSGESPSSLRDAIYKAIASSRSAIVELRFMNDTTIVANTFGFVKKLEASLFTSNPEIQITIECENAFLKGPTRIVQNLSGLDKGNPVLIDNISTAPHGLRLRIQFTASIGVFYFYETDTPGAEWFRIIYLFGSGDVLHFSSEQNNKYLYVVSGGVTTHLTDKLPDGRLWPIMFPGVNNYTINPLNYDYQEVSWESTFWGV